MPLPAGKVVKKAYLVWSGAQSNPVGGTLPAGTENNNITFTDPLGVTTSVARIPAYTQTTVSGQFSAYTQVADVTDLVNAGGPGFYTVGQIPCVLGNGGGGWTLMVAYDDSALTYKNITMWSAFETPPVGTTVDVPVTGFQTPLSGTPQAKLIISAKGGDSQQTGDFVKFGPTVGTEVTLSGSNNFFADQINNNAGVLDTTGTFGTQNVVPPAGASPGQRNLYDVTRVDASAGLTTNQTSAVISFGTNLDTYSVTNLGMSIEVMVPELIPIVKSVSKTTAKVEDVLTYTLNFTNSDIFPADNVTITDVLEPGLTFLPGSGTVNGGTFPLANIESGVNIGTVAPGASETITFQATVTSLPTVNPVPNTAELAYTFVPGPGAQPVSVSVSSTTVTTLIFEPSRGVLFI